jgi:hypothetical protein
MGPRSRRRLFAAPLTTTTTLAFVASTTACYTTTPYRPPPAPAPVTGVDATRPVPPVRVSVAVSPSALLLFQSAKGDTVSVAAYHLTGTVVALRGDTVVLRDPTMQGAPLRFDPAGGGRASVYASTALLAPSNHATLTVTRFSGLRSAMMVLGLLAALVGIVAASSGPV